MAAIETTGLTKRYGETLAVDDLELSIPEGVVYGFLGPNGAGKTTTMRLLTSLVRPSSGTVAGVTVGGVVVARLLYRRAVSQFERYTLS